MVLRRRWRRQIHRSRFSSTQRRQISLHAPRLQQKSKFWNKKNSWKYGSKNESWKTNHRNTNIRRPHNPFTGASADYNGDGKTDSLEEVGGYPYSERIAQKNDYAPILDEPTISKEKIKPVWSLIAGANVNSAFDKYGLSLGARVNPFRNEKIGLGLTADLGFGKDEQVDSHYFKFSEGEEYFGEINEVENRSFGLSAELQLYNFIVGGGFDYSKHISETNERLIRGEETLDSSSNSVSQGKIYGKGYLGVEFQPTKKLGIGATIGYHGKDGIQFGIKNTIKLNKRK